MHMFGNGRKTIGVIICDVTTYYQEQICLTLADYAERAGHNMAFFSNFKSFGGVGTRNGRGEANIFHLIPFEKLDAVIFCYDTFWNEQPLEDAWEMLNEKCQCPVITLRQDSGKYPCVLVDSEHCIEEIVYHFIDEHHTTKFGFMSGPFDHPDAISRLEQFKRALSNRNIDFEDKMVFEGDFWDQKGKEAAEYFTMELDECPEAIICANDYMALSLMHELIAKGIFVPDDIAITGFDNIWETSVAMPPITTISVPASEMAEKAVSMIEKIWAGETVERVTNVPASVILRSSCGCEMTDLHSLFAKHVRQMKDQKRMREISQSITYMMIDMSDLDKVDKIEKNIRMTDLFDDHVQSFFICLGEGRKEEYPKYRSADYGYAKKSTVVGGLFHGRPYTSESYETSCLLPENVAEDKSMIYYFFPLHNNQYSFGYFAMSFDMPYSINTSFQSCLAVLGNALETIRIKQKNQGLVRELNNLYIHDSLTGLRNRRGFETSSEEYFARAKKENLSLVIFAIDMDNLKIVNDRFGHMNGDLALKTIGAAMKAVARPEDACARVGGDEYNIIGVGYTKEEAEHLVRELEDYLKEFNDMSDLPYLVRASVGYSLIEAGQECELEQCINAADADLYKHKRAKKENKEDIVLRGN